MKIAIIGAGPAGLYLATLLGNGLKGAIIDVYEQNPANATYGFGVSLAGSSWSRMRDAHPASHDEIMAASYMGRDQVIGHRGERILVERETSSAGIKRLTLLTILRKHALEAGARLHDDTRIESLDDLVDIDLVVGADGANSVVRTTHEKEFGVTERELTNRMAWYGTEKHFAPPFLIFKKTEYGYFWSVGYAHTELTSTFVAECDAQAWTRSGLAEMTIEEQAAFSEEIFREELDGGKLINNNSIWRALKMVDATNWYVDNRVLIGDALHSAHPSIGSGTRMAIDDAIALALSIVEHSSDIPTALKKYQTDRGPSKQKLLQARNRSIDWYERIDDIADRLDPAKLAIDYMMRTGRISKTRLHEEFPYFVDRYGDQFPPNMFEQAGAS